MRKYKVEFYGGRGYVRHLGQSIQVGFKCNINHISDKVFKNGPSKICGRQPLKKISLQIFKRLSSTNFTWSVLEYFFPFDA